MSESEVGWHHMEEQECYLSCSRYISSINAARDAINYSGNTDALCWTLCQRKFSLMGC